MQWKKVEYSKNQIIKAGKYVRNNEQSKDAEYLNAKQIIDNWRAAHAYPLHVFYNYFKRNAKSDAIVVQRLKRLESIIAKLKREPNMSIWKMQDLGGCRVIVPSITDAYDVAKKYKKSRARHILIKEDDYISTPKESGYRCIHMIYKFFSNSNNTYNNNMCIEIQIRTHLQHLWSTAIESLGIFTGQNLKAGEGDEDFLRFFILTSSVFAIEENCAIIPNTATTIDGLKKEMIELNNKKNILATLRGVKVATNHIDTRIKNTKSGYYLLILNFNDSTLKIKQFKQGELDEAMKIYSSIENERAKTKINAVLVSAPSIDVLKDAYPNYFSDISKFVEKINSILDAE